MAELVDALASGASTGDGVGVRVPFWAPNLRTHVTFSSHIQIRLASLLDLAVLVNLQIVYEKFFQQLGCDSYEIFPSERRKNFWNLPFANLRHYRF